MMIHPLWAVLIPATLAISTPPVARPIATGRKRVSSAERAQLRQLEEYEAQRDAYRDQVKRAREQYYNEYLGRMTAYAAQVQLGRYNEMLKRQQAERESIEKTMRQYGVAPAGLLSDTSNAREVIEERPKSPFGDLRPLPGREESPPRSNKARAVQDSLAEVAMQPPSRTVPRPENQELHRKAMALEALCSRFLPTVRKHCVGERTAKEYQKRCAGYFHDCTSFLPKTDPLYNIAYAFNSNVGLNLGTVEVNGIPYYPINEEGSIGVTRQLNVPFGSWGGGYSDHIGVRDYWSQQTEIGANWYEGKYGYKFGWSVPLVQSLGIEGDTHALVSVPIKPGELGKPVGVDVGGGVGPYYQQNQHVGVDYLNGEVGTNFGVGVPFAGVGVNTGLGIKFPSVNDIVG
ncbi:hypothetical protein Q1695_012176 [Nippostrongylus brasiliensis]|nr:hypothetical protein Q1695_012176 [Nippostrongylus brasiliensis]